MRHEHERPVVVFALPEEQEIPVDLRFFQLFVYCRIQLREQLMKAAELFELRIVRVRHGLIRYHARELFRILPLACGVRVRRIIRGVFLHAQRADHCRKQKQHEYAEHGEQNIAYDSHAAVSFRERRYRKYATPMAIAPEGNIIKLVEPSSPGTRMKSTLIRTSGQSAIFMFFR